MLTAITQFLEFDSGISFIPNVMVIPLFLSCKSVISGNGMDEVKVRLTLGLKRLTFSPHSPPLLNLFSVLLTHL
jgi:hypothetical protein